MSTQNQKRTDTLGQAGLVLSVVSALVLVIAAISVDAKQFSNNGGNCDLYEICR